jgi:hypothetical protein
MSFLAPLFLAGLLVVAVPFWLHRLQTESSNRRSFSSAMLLETSEQRIHVRKELKYLVLLALRVLALALVTLAFARPLWTSPDALPGAAPDGTHIVLIDISASMGQTGMFGRALSLARDAIDAAPGGALLQVLTGGAEITEVTPVSADRATHLGALDTLSPEASRLDFGRAVGAIDRLAESLPRPVVLHFVSDLQDSALPVRFSDLVSSNVSSLIIHDAGDGAARNRAIESIRLTGGEATVSVSGTGDGADARALVLYLNDIRVGEQQVSGSGVSTVRFSGLELEPGDNRLRAELDDDDDLGADDSRYHVATNDPPTPIPLITLNRGGLPVTYLSAALHSDPDGAYQVEPAVIGEFDTRTLPRYRWAVVDDIGSVGPDLEAALIEFVTAGGGLLAFAGERTATATRMPILGNGISGASIGGAGAGFLSVGQVDTGHPLLAETQGWYAVNLTQSTPVQPATADQVLIRLENGEPFLIERRIGQGRMLLVTAGLENQSNDLPIRPVFVSFMIESAQYLSGTEQQQRSFAAGDLLPLSQAGTTSGQVIDPDGSSILSLVDTTRAQRIPLRKTGFYEVYTRESEYVVAVNIDPRESQLAPITAATRQRWETAMSGASATQGTVTLDIEAQPYELWHILLLVLALVLIAEAILANVYLAPRTTAGSNG